MVEAIEIKSESNKIQTANKQVFAHELYGGDLYA